MYNNQYYPYYYPQQQRLNQLEQQYPQYANNNNYMPPMQQMNAQQMPNMQQVQQQPAQQIPQLVLQGKAVDSIEVVKATDVPLDGSITYFPKTDGTAIYTKQLQKDGTSKLTIYEAVTDEGSHIQTIDTSSVVQKEDIEKIYADISDVKKSLVNAMNDLFDRFDDFRDEIALKLKEEKKPTTTSRGGKR